MNILPSIELLVGSRNAARLCLKPKDAEKQPETDLDTTKYISNTKRRGKNCIWLPKAGKNDCVRKLSTENSSKIQDKWFPRISYSNLLHEAVTNRLPQNVTTTNLLTVGVDPAEVLMVNELVENRAPGSPTKHLSQ